MIAMHIEDNYQKMLNVRLKVRSRELVCDEGCCKCNVGLGVDYRVDRHQAGEYAHYMTFINIFWCSHLTNRAISILKSSSKSTLKFEFCCHSDITRS